jgi:hypothetical protein
MRISKNRVLDFLTRCQIEKGGYTGIDVTTLAKSIPVSPQALRKRIDDWNSSDQTFKQLRYLGKQTIPLSIDDFVLIRQWLKENPLGRISDILQELNDNRQKQGKDSIPQSPFYRFVNSQKESLTGNVPRELQWLIFNRIKVTDTYILANARASLSTVFTYTDLKTFGGIDIDGIASRLQEAQKCFQQTYPGADPFEWFPRIRLRSKVIRNQLSRIKADKALPFQARLIFEAQVDFIVRLKDILIDELIHRMGWIQRSKDGNRQKIENRIRTQWIDKYYDVGDKVSANPNEGNLAKLKELIDRGKPESDEAELEIMKQHQVDYEKIYEHLKKLTNNFSEEEITHHHTTAQVLLDLCRGERKWAFLTEKERKKMTKNRLIQCTVDSKQCLKAVFTKKLISYLRKGKITLTHSFKYQDIGKVIESVELSDTDWMVTRRDIEKLIEGTYPINFESESFQRSPTPDDELDAQDYQTLNKIPFQQVQNQVSGLVADHNPTWFQSHKEIFEKMTDGMFEMEYDELTFLIRLYEAIGFLGRNLRFSDSPSFYRLQYFIQRYLSDATLDLEFRHLWKVYEALTGHKTPIIIIDSMGIDSRRKSLFAKVHGRYRTIGFADVRAVSPYLIPVFSSNCRSSDSEAMNMMEIVNHAKSVLGEEFKFCAGNAHTVSRVAAGLAFAGHKVILLGRYPHPPTKPGKICLSRLHKHLELTNEVGKLVREDSEFGKIFTSREHIFADGMNVRNLLRDLGMLILWNSKQEGYDLDDLIQLVETSNRQKRVVRIVERGVTRVSEPNVSLVLKSAELILLMSAIVNILNGRQSLKWRGMSPVSMENIVLFVPA